MEYLQKYKLYFSTFYIHALSVHPYIRKKQEHFRTPASLSDQPRLPPDFIPSLLYRRTVVFFVIRVLYLVCLRRQRSYLFKLQSLGELLQP